MLHGDAETGGMIDGQMRDMASEGKRLSIDELKKLHELKTGALPYIVEYTYEKEYESLFFWPAWLPQEDVPVLKSTYTLNGHNKIQYRTHAIGFLVGVAFGIAYFSKRKEELRAAERIQLE